MDVYPPLFYILINIISSLFPNTFSKWIGLGLNIVCYIAIIALIYLTGNKLFENKWISVMLALVFGCCKNSN